MGQSMNAAIADFEDCEAARWPRHSMAVRLPLIATAKVAGRERAVHASAIIRDRDKFSPAIFLPVPPRQGP